MLVIAYVSSSVTPHACEGRSWLDKVEVVTGNALTEGALTDALKGVSVAYYFIHGKKGGKESAKRDLTIARNFAECRKRSKHRTDHLSRRTG